DWLAYGLEDAFSENPEVGIVRKHRTDSGLIRYDQRRDLEWPQVAREIIAAEKPKFIVMMIGNNDRQTIREKDPPAPPRPATPKRARGRPAPPSTPPAPPPAASDPAARRRATAARPLRGRRTRQHGAGAGAPGILRTVGIPHGEVGARLYQAHRCDYRRPQERRRSGDVGRSAVAARHQGECRFLLSQRALP